MQAVLPAIRCATCDQKLCLAALGIVRSLSALLGTPAARVVDATLTHDALDALLVLSDCGCALRRAAPRLVSARVASRLPARPAAALCVAFRLSLCGRFAQHGDRGGYDRAAL